jgi:hypothetical protein
VLASDKSRANFALSLHLAVPSLLPCILPDQTPQQRLCLFLPAQSGVRPLVSGRPRPRRSFAMLCDNVTEDEAARGAVTLPTFFFSKYGRLGL